MKQAYREIQGKRSRKIRFALLTTIMMAMLVLQACGNNTGGNGASASGGSNTEKAGEEYEHEQCSSGIELWVYRFQQIECARRCRGLGLL